MVGCGGTGKSTFSDRAARRLGLPLVDLDDLSWGPQCSRPATDDWRAAVSRVVAGDRWIVDGNDKATFDLRLPAADLVVVLDRPRWLCLVRVVRRRWRGRHRPSSTADCADRLTPAYLRWVWRYRRRNLPRLLDRLTDGSTPFVVTRTEQDLADLLDELASLPAASALTGRAGTPRDGGT